MIENNQHTPTVSIISFTKKIVSLERLALAEQSYQDYELIIGDGYISSKSLRHAIAQARGEILVFIDPDARPVDNHWLEELVAGVTDEQTIVKGLEVTSSPLDPSSLAGFRQAFLDHPFNESYPWSEDTELFCRLKAHGYRFVQLECAPVIHLSKPGSRTYRRRAFRYGIYYSRIRHHYAEPVELASVTDTIKEIFKASMYLLGMMIGTILYWPEGRRWRAPNRAAEKDLGEVAQ